MVRRGTVARSRATFIMVASMVIMSMLAAPAGADTEIKEFTAVATPLEVVAGVGAVTFTVEITNEPGTPHELGSANITIPDAFGGGVVELRNLALDPGASASVDIDAYVGCVDPGDYYWGIAVKQSNDFNGTGNDFVGNAPVTTVTASCFLGWVAAPGDGVRDTGLSSVDYGSPDADPIVVGVFDGAGQPTGAWTAPVALELVDNPGGASLTGGVTTPAAGYAVFDGDDAPVVDVSAAGYTMRATSTDGYSVLATGISDPFSIVDSYVACDGGPCSASSSATNAFGVTDADVFSDSAGAIIVSVGAATGSLDCAGYDESSSLVEFDVFESSLSKTVIMTWTPWLQPARKYRVCWGSPDPFVTRDGVAADFVDGWYVGLLPNCRKNGPTAPCVSGYSQDRKSGSVTITVLAPVGDPRMRI